MNLRGLYQSKKSVGINKHIHPTDTLATTLLKPTGEENIYVQFLYSPQKNLNHTRVQVLVSINANPINTKKQVNNKLL